MLPEKFYPLEGEITLSDINTNKMILKASCYIPRYNEGVFDQWSNEWFNFNEYIYINTDFTNVNVETLHEKYGNCITIKAGDVPSVYKYQLDIPVKDEDFDTLIINGKAKVDNGLTITFTQDTDITAKLTPVWDGETLCTLMRCNDE